MKEPVDIKKQKIIEEEQGILDNSNINDWSNITEYSLSTQDDMDALISNDTHSFDNNQKSVRRKKLSLY